jgi:hypothetical protein
MERFSQRIGRLPRCGVRARRYETGIPIALVARAVRIYTSD